MRLSRTTLLLSLCLSCTAAFAAPPINTLDGGVFEHRTDTAIRGYDAVGYFADGKPELGTDAYVYDWMGAKWKFASAEHLAAFKAEPQKYAPQYGGYCAYGVAKDHLVSVEPDKWKIVDGKLYLNYNGDVQAKWNKDPAGFIKEADGKFAELLKK